MSQELAWVAIDIVSACMESKISLNFRNDKRFYRVRLKDRCGIFDLRSHSFVETTEAVFSEKMERLYRLAGNDLHAIETVASQCQPELDDIGLLYNSRPSDNPTTLSINSELLG
jgi:hypothetical protein